MNTSRARSRNVYQRFDSAKALNVLVDPSVQVVVVLHRNSSGVNKELSQMVNASACFSMVLQEERLNGTRGRIAG